MNNKMRNVALWLVIGVMILALFNIFQSSNQPTVASKITYSAFMEAVEQGQVQSVTIRGQDIIGASSNLGSFSTTVPNGTNIAEQLRQSGVDITAEPVVRETSLFGEILPLLPMIVIIGFWIYMFRQMQGGGGKGGAMGFGKSRAKMLTETKGRVTFDDVAGIDEAKQELEEIVDFLRDPQKFNRLGGKMPRGVLLVGPPGTGKTLTGRAVAGEAGVPFFSISGSDFVEMFVGVGASRVRDMFEQAKQNAPCIIFIDEIDAVGRHRGAGMGGGNDEREQTLNQLLVEMDGFEANEGIILIAATNRPDVLDKALLRPGRFDRQVVVPNPDITGREKILKVHGKKVPLAPNVSLKVLARGTPGFSGADLANLVNEAALLAARHDKRLVTMQDFEDAKDKIMMGAERRTLVMTEEERKNTAYHEAAHALVALTVPGAHPVHKATIIPRGRALGLVMQLPERDQISQSYQQMTSQLAIMMAGRIAEELIFGAEKVTSGASSDIQQATKLATSMVTEWGFSDEVGTVLYADNQQNGYLGGQSGQASMSEETARKIDAEVRRFVDMGNKEARRILTERADDLEALAQGLLEYETLSGDEILELLKGNPPVRDMDDDAPSSGGGLSSMIPTTGSQNKADDGLGDDAEPQPN